MAKITGRIEVLVNGQTLLNKPGATAEGIGVSGKPPVELTPIVGDTGIHGFTEKIVVPKAVVKITDRSDLMLSDLAQVRENGTVIFRSAGGGKAYTLNDATCLGNFKLTGGEGEVEVSFVGSCWNEMVDN
jgi:hypothetical protein